MPPIRATRSASASILILFLSVITPLGITFSGIALSGSAQAASPEPGDTTYHNLRYEDDFSHPGPPDIWDPIKFIPLGDGQYGPSYLTLGGELRERFESYLNPNFGLKAPPSDAYLLQRLLLDLDAHITNTIRVFLQLGEFDRLGNRGVSSTTDIDHLDLTQAFIDLNLPSPLHDAPTIRVGREELLFGYQRLIAVREGPNVRRDFDGVRFTDHWDEATFDFLTVRPVNPSQGVFDDHTNENQILWGAYLTLPLGNFTKVDLYQLNYRNETAKFRGLSGVEQRHTFGTRLFGATEGFDWNAEVALQSGTFRNMDIRAEMLAAIAGYTVAEMDWQPRIGIETNYASGDTTHANAIGTFNAMYPRLPYFAETSLLVPANIFDVRPVLSFKPTPDILATFGWDNLWRASASDGLYGSGMAEYANTGKFSGARVGTELSADIRWRLDRHLLLGAIAAEFIAGPAVQEALGKTVTFFVLFATYRF